MEIALEPYFSIIFMGVMIIEATNLKLAPCDQETLKAVMEGNESLSQQLGIPVAEDWLYADNHSLEQASQCLEEVAEKGWWLYLVIDKEENVVVGSGGFKGKPDEKGMVEVGYEISPAHRGNDFATEVMEALIDHAFGNFRVKMITSYTLGELNRYAKVLLNCGFKRVERIKDTGEGIQWKWQLKRN